MAAMLDDKTKGSVIQHGCHTIIFWISRDWLQTTYIFKELYSNMKLLLEQQEKNIEELPRREEQTIVGF